MHEYSACCKKFIHMPTPFASLAHGSTQAAQHRVKLDKMDGRPIYLALYREGPKAIELQKQEIDHRPFPRYRTRANEMGITDFVRRKK